MVLGVLLVLSVPGIEVSLKCQRGRHWFMERVLVEFPSHIIFSQDSTLSILRGS